MGGRRHGGAVGRRRGVTNAVSAWLWNWPPMESRWNPRFEATIRVHLGELVLHGRPDLMLGRPRPDAVPSMAIADLKVGMVRDSHRTDAGCTR